MSKSTFVSLFIATCAAMLGIGIILPILPLYAKSLHASALSIGLLFSAFALSRMFFAPYLGALSDRLGKRRLLLWGLALYAFFAFLYPFVTNATYLFALRFFDGIASAMVTPIAQAYVGDIVPKGKEGKYMNLFSMSMFSGSALGPIVGGTLADHFGLHMPFYALTSVSLFAFALVWFFIPHQQQSKPTRKTHKRHQLLNVLKDRPMRGVLAYILFRAFYRFGFNTFIPLLTVSYMSKSNIGVLLSLYMVFGSVLQYPMGLLCDRFSNWKAPFILWGSLLSAVCMTALFWFHQNVAVLYLFAIGMGVFSALSRAAIIVVRTERGRTLGMGTVTGSFASAQALGQMSGPIILGLFVDWMGLPYVFLVGGLVGIIGAILSYYFIRQYDSNPQVDTHLSRDIKS
ncbi:MFS transporter [Vibrio sp. CAIM 722]|uniref:MFS transporter n=1 Tax=Vibrio eleionomae TaxID=2653505 RepID=A0A7X4LQI1_9VIBR|nr:MFS transporter [Vibrio eleionomae]